VRKHVKPSKVKSVLRNSNCTTSLFCSLKKKKQRVTHTAQLLLTCKATQQQGKGREKNSDFSRKEKNPIMADKEAEKQVMIEEDKEKWLKHYSSNHQILLVGDGDFSFSLSLALSFGSGSNIVASSLDTSGNVLYTLLFSCLSICVCACMYSCLWSCLCVCVFFLFFLMVLCITRSWIDRVLLLF